MNLALEKRGDDNLLGHTPYYARKDDSNGKRQPQWQAQNADKKPAGPHTNHCEVALPKIYQLGGVDDYRIRQSHETKETTR
jgi:hypothetical protein